MTLKYIDEYRDSELARHLIDKIKSTSKRPIRLMEVCGTHTVSIFRSGIRIRFTGNHIFTLRAGVSGVCNGSNRY